MIKVISFDFETYRFGPRKLAPKPVCLSMDDGGGGVVIASCEPSFKPALEHTLKTELITGVNIAYDMAVILAHLPEFSELVWKAYEEDRVTDIIIREKLRILADTGDLKYASLPNGAKMKLTFSQGELEKRLLGIDRTEDKKDEDSWRTNYEALDGIPASEYPADAYAYSRDDASNGFKIHALQEVDSQYLRAQFLNARAAFALQLSSCWGFPVDGERVEKAFAELSEAYDEKNYPDLLRSGILKPSVPPKPYKRQIKKAVEILGQEPEDWTPFKEKLEAEGIKFKAAEECKKNDSVLRDYVELLCKKHEIPIVYTDGETPKVSYAEETQVALKGLDSVFDQFIDRNEIQKLVTTELPRMRNGRVHPNYDILKTTSRTSSYGNSKKDKDPAYPAVNIQQIDPRVRESYIPDPGWALCSIDYNAIELVSAAQTCLDLFGESRLAEMINAGRDPHCELAVRLAKRFEGFQGGYEDFVAKEHSDPKWFKHWRGLSKPTGLGYWGGLGKRTFVSYAKKTYGIDLIQMAGSLEGAEEMAEAMRQEWHEMLPEASSYFNWINTECGDLDWSLANWKKYAYTSPHGTLRRNCDYCAAANGRALQTPTGEGAKISLFSLAEAFYRRSLNSPLLGCRQYAFVHDEVLWGLPIDDYMHDRVMEAARLMEEGMARIMTRVKVSTSACLMLRWNKDAKPVFDNNHRLTIWKPQ